MLCPTSYTVSSCNPNQPIYSGCNYKHSPSIYLLSIQPFPSFDPHFRTQTCNLNRSTSSLLIWKHTNSNSNLHLELPPCVTTPQRTRNPIIHHAPMLLSLILFIISAHSMTSMSLQTSPPCTTICSPSKRAVCKPS